MKLVSEERKVPEEKYDENECIQYFALAYDDSKTHTHALTATANRKYLTKLQNVKLIIIGKTLTFIMKNQI